jgi:hypothetical protein
VNLEKLVADCRRWGLPRALFMRLMNRLERHADFHLYRVYARPLSAGHPPVVTDPGISFRVAAPQDLHEAARDPALDLDPDFIRQALARGDRAFAAYDGEALVAYTWCTSSAAPHLDGLWVKVGAPYAYGYKTFTRESHRGKRLAGAVSLFSDADGLERGHAAVINFVEVSNSASLSVERTVGARPIGYVGYAKWFGHILAYRSPGAKKVGFEFFFPTQEQEEARPYFEEESEAPDQRAG